MDSGVSLQQYYGYAYRCVNEIESITRRPWKTPTYSDTMKELQQKDDMFLGELPAYDYLIYLRHHGFPSPLLDWTESPYIAAYFAFSERRNAPEVAVYAYIESVSRVRSGMEGAPSITVYGPYVTTDRRHFAQKTRFTTATEWNCTERKRYFCSHENVFRRNDALQDVLIKISIPSTARKEALMELSDYNITPYTLFHSEDSLIKSMELKVFDLEGY